MIDLTLERIEEVRASITEDDGQNVFSLLLDRCPFCGSEHAMRNERPGPYVQVWNGLGGLSDTLVDARVVCGTCHVSTTRSTASKVFVNETNEDVTRLHAISMAIDDWNRRA